MNDSKRGISCTLNEGGIQELLLLLAQTSCTFFVPWCSKIDSPKQWLPGDTRDFYLDSQGLCELTQSTIWELVLHMYPAGETAEHIENYEDFLKSKCFCCMIYYDCGWLAIYIKDPVLFEQVHNKLLVLNAEDFEILTAANDTRTALMC